MSDSKVVGKHTHTPGPWFVTGRMTKYVEARIGGGLIQEIASVGPTAADCGYGETQEANARLISASPDLLEAIEPLIKMAIAGDKYSCADLGRKYVEDERVAKAKSAIAKAKGLAQ